MESIVLTPEEKEKILRSAFAELEPMKLKALPSKQNKKIVVLEQIATAFEKDRVYTVKEVNDILSPIYTDFVTVRRDLIDFKFMERNTNGSEYKLK